MVIRYRRVDLTAPGQWIKRRMRWSDPGREVTVSRGVEPCGTYRFQFRAQAAGRRSKLETLSFESRLSGPGMPAEVQVGLRVDPANEGNKLERKSTSYIRNVLYSRTSILRCSWSALKKNRDISQY